MLPVQRVGGACIWLDDEYVRHPLINMRQTNVRNLTNAPSEKERQAWLHDLVQHNLRALWLQVQSLTRLSPCLRMWRISSELLPVATHPITAKFYKRSDIQQLIESKLARIGELARKFQVRLSFHPAQFVVLGSKNPGIRENAIRELIYHCDVFTMMGYTGWHQDGTSVNVHVGPKEAAVPEMRKLLKNSPRNILQFLTLENDEFSWSAEKIAHTFGDMVPVVLDIHHYWIHHGKRLRPDSELADLIRMTWRWERPKLHHALTEAHMCGMCELDAPIKIDPLIEAGWPKSKLRIHSDHPWHDWSNEYAAAFGFDVMWEGKDKNQGAFQIARQLNWIDQ